MAFFLSLNLFIGLKPKYKIFTLSTYKALKRDHLQSFRLLIKHMCNSNVNI